MNYKSALHYVCNLRHQQDITHFAELYNIDLTSIKSKKAMIAKLKETLQYRNNCNLNIRGI